MVARVRCLHWHELEIMQPDGSRIELLAVEIDKRAKEVIPLAEELQDRYCHQRRLHERNQHVPQDAKWSSAVQCGCLIQIARNAHQKLTQEKDHKGISRQP